MMFDGRFEFSKTTQRMVMLVHMVKAIRQSPLPYVYLTKKEYEELGGVIPPRDEFGNYTAPYPRDAMDITIRRADSH